MKRVISFVLCLALFVSCFVFGAHAETTTSVVYLEDGSYILTEITVRNPLARATTSGDKKVTYVNSSNKKIYSVTVNGAFTYTYGSSATATSSTATITIHTSDAKYVSRNAYCSGASAYATSTFTYGGSTRTLTAKLTCDKYGNLS